MIEYILCVVIGAVVAWRLAIWMIDRHPELAVRLGMPIEPDYSGEDLPPEVERGPAAVDPSSLPKSTTNEEIKEKQEKGQQIVPHKNLDELMKLLLKWKPQRHSKERAFHRSFSRFLAAEGYPKEAIEHERRINPRGDKPKSDERFAIPDFIIRGNVLVEIKKEFDMSSTADRAVGQITRYIAYWRKKGPSLLLVCSDYDEQLRKVVEAQIDRWQARDIPVTSHFVRSPKG